MRFPLPLTAKIAGHIIKHKLRRTPKFAMVLQLEPLHTCNLTCTGCGRIREYSTSLKDMMSLEDCLESANECDAPMVSICGGEPLIHPEIDAMIEGILEQGRVVYVCTNGMFMRKKMKAYLASVYSPTLEPKLRELLNVAERSGLDVQLAPILDIDLDPVKQRLVLDAGSREGVHVGQAVIDAGGLMGQVISVTGGTSTVLLLTDPDHAVPVTVARNGVRLIVYGRGDKLELRDIPLSAGVEVGDEIVTSGLGGRFPAGFPVGTITGLRPDDTHAFLVGELKPAAQLDRGRDVLLLRPGAAIRIPPNLRLQLEETAPGGPATGAAVPAPTAPPATSPAAGPASVAATPAPATATPAAPSPAKAASTVPQATEPPPPAAEAQR